MSEPTGLVHYEIRAQGALDERWRSWFDGVQVRAEGAETVIRGSIDQAALHGLLGKIRDLGLSLVSVQRLD